MRTTDATQSAVYQLHGVTQRYGDRKVLSIDALTIRPGEILALVGPSGAGKSTLLRLLAFLETPADGTIRFQSRPVTPHWPDLPARRKVGLVFQRPHLLQRSVRDNIRYSLRIRGERGGAIDRRVDELIERLGLGKVSDAAARSLSGGEAQRVALARALVTQPDVLLLDEPTANLDPTNINLIESMVRHANETRRTTVIIVTHNIFQARRLAHRTGLLMAGRLVELAPTERFFTTPAQPETAAFVRGELVY